MAHKVGTANGKYHTGNTQPEYQAPINGFPEQREFGCVAEHVQQPGKHQHGLKIIEELGDGNEK